MPPRVFGPLGPKTLRGQQYLYILSYSSITWGVLRCLLGFLALWDQKPCGGNKTNVEVAKRMSKLNKTNVEVAKRMSKLNKTNVEVAKRMSWLNERNVEFEKPRWYTKTTIKLNFDRKNAP